MGSKIRSLMKNERIYTFLKGEGKTHEEYHIERVKETPGMWWGIDKSNPDAMKQGLEILERSITNTDISHLFNEKDLTTDHAILKGVIKGATELFDKSGENVLQCKKCKGTGKLTRTRCRIIQW